MQQIQIQNGCHSTPTTSKIAFCLIGKGNTLSNVSQRPSPCTHNARVHVICCTKDANIQCKTWLPWGSKACAPRNLNSDGPLRSTLHIKDLLPLLKELKHCCGHLNPIWVLVWVPMAQQGSPLFHPCFFGLHRLELKQFVQNLCLRLFDLWAPFACGYCARRSSSCFP